jgi:hypothetical protein
VVARQRLPMERRVDLHGSGLERPSGRAPVGPGQRLPVEDVRVCGGSQRRPSRRAPVAVRQRLSVGPVDVCECGGGRPSRDASVGARQRLSMGRADLRLCGRGRPSRSAAVGAPTAAPGPSGRVRTRRREAISQCSSGRANDCPWDQWTCAWRPSRGAPVGARQRLSLGPVDVCVGSQGRPPRGAPVGTLQWLPVGRGDVSPTSRGRSRRARLKKSQYLTGRGTRVVACSRVCFSLVASSITRSVIASAWAQLAVPSARKRKSRQVGWERSK